LPFPAKGNGKGREGKGREGKGREGKGREGKGREGKGREGKLVSLFIAGAAISESITSLSVKVQNKFMKGVDVEKAGVINVKFPNEGDI
jgi:hypothetical protein